VTDTVASNPQLLASPAPSRRAGSSARRKASAPLTLGVEPTLLHDRPTGANGAVSRNGDHTTLNGVRVLVVDDQPDAREVIAAMLRRCGAEVATAGSATEAMESFRRSRPDVLVSDLAMPDRDGFDLIRSVRELTPNQGGEVPAVALTAYARPEDRVRVLSAGFQMHVAKPVDPQNLIAAVAHLSAQSKAQAVAPVQLI
jgi:CheY-like chemotaxis protein